MKSFMSLVWREWREVRALTLGCAVLAVVVTAVVQHYVFKYVEPGWAAAHLVPWLALLYAVVVASDLIATDVKSRRIDGLALLPIPLRRVWGAKVAFLLTIVTAFYAYVFLLQVPFLAAFGEKEGLGAFLAAAEKSWITLLPGIAAMCAVVFFSTMAMRSFVAAILGIVSVGAIVSAFVALRLDLIIDPDPFTLSYAILLLAVLFLGASGGAFVFGPIHSGRRLRLLTVGFGTVLALLVPASAATALQVHAYNALSPGDAEVECEQIVVSPDGRYVALSVYKERGTPRDTHLDRPNTGRVWIVRIEDGEIFDWSGAATGLAGWTRSGALWVAGYREDGEAEYGRWVEPETGALIRRGRKADLRNELIHVTAPRQPWGAVKGNANTIRERLGAYTIRDVESGDDHEVVSKGHPTVLPKRGHVVTCSADGALEVVNILDESRRTILESGAEGAVGQWSVSPTGRFFLANTETGYAIVDVEQGGVVKTFPESNHWHHWIRPAHGRDLLQVPAARDSQRVRLVFDAAAGTAIEMSEDLSIYNHYGFVAPLPDGRLVAYSKFRGLVLLAADGSFERVLYAKPAGTAR